MPHRIFNRKIFQKNKKLSKARRILKIMMWGALVLIGTAFLIFFYYAKDLPRPENFTERTLSQTTKIFDRSGQTLLYEIYGEEKRTWAPLDIIPQRLKNAVIASEDANFYQHFGIDPKGVLRSILINLRLGKPVYGGSTIPQQLIRSTFFSTKKTLQRKVREIILALELDRRYSKDQILEWYLNQVPFGQNTYGVEAASQTYFRKPVSEISLPEAAVLTALIQAPSYLSPYGNHKDELLSRKNVVLDRMTALGYITKAEAEQNKIIEVVFAKPAPLIKAPHFTLWVKDYLTTKYGEDFLRGKGLRVYTSLDWDLQQAAEKVVAARAKINEVNGAYNTSLVAINPKSGEVLAMVGSKDWFADSYPPGCTPGTNCLFEPYPNVALRGRQPGSSFKPFVYVTAFKKGFDDKYVVIDEPTNFGTEQNPYTPQNYDGKFRGPVTLREGLAQSLNVPSIKVLDDLAGLGDSIQTAKDFGITTLTQPPSFYGLPLVLGGGDVKLLEMVSAYGVFANEGLQIPPVAILKIEDSDGNIIEENKKTLKRVIEREPCQLITSILSDNNARAPIFGYNSSMYFENYQVAAKTGTTQNYKDGWIIGYTPQIVAGVWVGNNNAVPISEKPGVVVAGPIWRGFMEQALLKLSPLPQRPSLPQPENQELE